MKSLSLALLLALASLGARAEVALKVIPALTIGDDFRSTWRVVITNDGTAKDDLPFSFHLSVAKVVTVPQAEDLKCRIPFDTGADCKIDLAPNASRELTFTSESYNNVRYQWMWGQVSSIGIVANDVAVFSHPYVVTTVADDGPGSLRQAIVDINRECLPNDVDPCSALFQIDEPVPADGQLTIRLESPLPTITALNFDLDGATQTRHNGATITIDGSKLAQGSGLQLRQGYSRVADVRIAGFPGSGITCIGGSSLVQRSVLTANGLRGIQVDGGVSDVRDSELSANGHSGGWFSTSGTVFVRNRIVDNGASGLFFHKPAITFWPSTVENNEIANNAHAGIALSAQATGKYAPNTMYANGGEAVDMEIDGPTLESRGTIPGQGGILGAPVVTSARYDGTATIIEGRLAGSINTTHVASTVYVYASRSVDSRGIAEAEQLLGIGPLRSSGPNREFTLRVERDLRGLWVNAAHFGIYVYNWDDPAWTTSELGLPRQVE